MSAAGGCACTVCGDALKRGMPRFRKTVLRHARAHDTSPSKRVRASPPPEEDTAAESDVLGSSDTSEAEDHKHGEDRSGAERGEDRSGAERLRQFSKEILEFIGANDVNQTHVIKILRTVRAHLGRCSETGIVCPVTLYTLKKHAGYTPSAGTSLLRLCTQDHPNLPDAANCSTCTSKVLTRWPRRMVYVDVVDRLTRLMAVAAIAKAFQYAHDREPGDGDMWDGKRGSEISLARRRDVFFLGLSSDATEFGHTKSASLTPFVALVLNFPPSMRTTFSAIMLLAVFPEKVRAYARHVRLCACVCV